jgi:hypothetical protein
MPGTRHYLLLVLILMTSCIYGQTVHIYRWIDPVNGEIHYGDKPPANSDYTTLEIQAQPALGDQSVRNRLENMQRRAESWRLKDEERMQQKKRLAAEQAARKLNCKRARDHLATLESRPGHRLLVTDLKNGNTHRMTEPERQKNIIDAKTRISQLCK